MNYQLLLFDFDGTLVDTVSDIGHYANQILKSRGYPRASIPDVKHAVGWGVHELLQILAPGFRSDPSDLEKAVEEFKAAYRARPVRVTKPFPFVDEMLAGPLKKARRAIVTNKPQDITLRILDELDLAKYFEAVIGVGGDFPPKPDPSSVLHLIGRAGVAKERTLYIGDSCVDAETSALAGIDFAWMSYGYQALGDAPAKFRFDSAAEWEKLV
jgi:phosphoglycolate phosphatase